MIARTMTHAELLAEARKDLPALRTQLDRPLQRLRLEHERNGKQAVTHLLPWRSPRKNEWLVLVHYSSSAVRVHSLLWFTDASGEVAALWTGATGMAYYIDAHAFARYAERFDPTASVAERVQSFFLDNPYFELQVEQPRGEFHWDVSVGIHQGLGLGVWDTTTDIVHVRTFVPINTLMEPGMPQLDGPRSPFRGLSLQQRIDLADRAVQLERQQRAA